MATRLSVLIWKLRLHYARALQQYSADMKTCHAVNAIWNHIHLHKPDEFDPDLGIIDDHDMRWFGWFAAHDVNHDSQESANVVGVRLEKMAMDELERLAANPPREGG